MSEGQTSLHASSYLSAVGYSPALQNYEAGGVVKTVHVSTLLVNVADGDSLYIEEVLTEEKNIDSTSHFLRP